MERIGRYRVIRQLGHGGMGDVYLAHDPDLERDVALKVLRGTEAGLRDEARALAALRHPGIVTVFEIGEHAGQDFIAMEYLPGQTLRQMIQEGRPRERLVAICAKVAVAVAAAHRAGILHRDIKPENVIVDGDEVKVVDFGLANRLVDERGLDELGKARGTLPPRVRKSLEMAAVTRDTLIEAPSVRGTPAYVAPEVLVGLAATAASDIYSLGVMLHECLAGRRPTDATNVIEAIAALVDGPPPRLADPLGELVERMLAHDPKARPNLDEIATALAPRESAPLVVSIVAAQPLPPRRRWPVAIVAIVALAVASGVAAWQITRTRPVTSASIAVSPFAIDFPSYGREPLSPPVVADTLAQLFGEVEGTKLVGSTVPSVDPRGSAHALGAQYFVRGRIEERHGRLHADVELLSLATERSVATLAAERSVDDLAGLLDDVTSQIARTIQSDAHLPTGPDRRRAEQFHRAGDALFRDGRFTEARPYFEQAVDADPSYVDAWYGLAITRAWSSAADELVLAAARRAQTLSTGAKAELMRGMVLFLEHDFGAARGVLEPIIDAAGVDRTLALYFLGEANWHDGRHAPAFDAFKRALDADRRFTPAAIHAWQYAVARRDPTTTGRYLGVAKGEEEWLDFAGGDYAAAATHASPLGHWAELILGRTSPGLDAKIAADDLDSATLRIAIAIGKHDVDTARRELAAAWTTWVAKPDNVGNVIYALDGLGEVMLCAGFDAELRQILGFLAEHSKTTPARGYHRLAALAAPVLGDAALVPRDHLSERDTMLAKAATAELAGDRTQAAAILESLVADPTFSWEYPERCALIRNLRALGKPIAALCEQTLKPPIPRPAWLVIRDLCTTR